MRLNLVYLRDVSVQKQRTYEKPRGACFFPISTKIMKVFLVGSGGKNHKQERYNQHRLLFTKSHLGYDEITHLNIREGKANEKKDFCVDSGVQH